MNRLISLFTDIISDFVNAVGTIFIQLLPDNMDFLTEIGFNIYLFSDTGWFTQPIPLVYIFLFSLITFAFIFILRLLWKGTKKFITMVFGVFKL